MQVVLDLHRRDEVFFPSMAGSRTILGRCTGGTIANLLSGPHAGFGRAPLPRVDSFLAVVRKVPFASVRRETFLAVVRKVPFAGVLRATQNGE